MAQRQTLPVLPLRGTVIFPGLTQPIAAGRPSTLRAIEAALNQTPEEGRRRMRALRRQVLAHDVDRWARSFLDALASTNSAKSE